MLDYHIIVIGGGGTGAAVIHDLTQRGFKATLVERGELTSGTTGRHHGLLHSGGRYAVKDQESAIECIEENMILRKIAPEALELNEGLFVAITDEDEAYAEAFLSGCEECHIPTRTLTPKQTLELEPKLNPKLRLAVQVPDGTIDAWRLPLHFFATAKHRGADIRTYAEVIGFLQQGGVVSGVRVRDHRTNQEYDLKGDLVVNATGAWAEKVTAMANADVPIRPSPGVMVAVRGRYHNMVLNRLHASGDGDIIVPQRNLSVIGTSSWVVDDPDKLGLPEDHIQAMFKYGSEMVPTIKDAPFRAAWSAARPLIGSKGEDEGRELSRTFKCFDHKERDGVEGLVTISGGKATTLRGMAETTVNVVCQKLGLDIPCRTKEEVLLPYRAYYN
ncbi:MAG: FAD-dependent oxidoreductase [Anaerolineales bacterium]|nr:FAD-dependent oxidoreductase [Anaerolineales bacterium]